MAMRSIVYRLDDPGFTIYHRAAWAAWPRRFARGTSTESPNV